ncbi:CoA transferase [Pseudomonas benzenivorans]|uniref:CoA transferase n=1 Tax=Pseudomonas benzenivorans TaxID=556533 RepID=A0ABY5H4D7_9PSED|nr:CoA transferase [Pseudomonas benzenivorans]UTW06302.1 CoA transferase [Pseudomonas benzenivorans]
MQTNRQRPLSGYRVVDFGQYIAGPAVAMMLADQGAAVIHIDPPQGPRWDNPADAILNRGKQRISLDLHSEADLQLAIDLVRHADVLVENFRPGVMERLGLGAEAMRALNPALVYLSLPGFSEKDEDYAHLPAWEGIIAAAVGQFTDMGLSRVLMGITPSFSPLPLASAYASVLGATSVTLALFARVKSGQGERIEVPIAAALMEGLAYNSMHIEGLSERYKSLREREIERRRTNGLPLNLQYADLQEFLDPFYRTYVCQDGRPFYAVNCSHTRHPIACLKVLGLWDELAGLGIPTHSPYLDVADWPEGAECTLLSYPLSRAWADLVSEKMKAAFLSKPAYEWQRLFGEAGVPGCAHQLSAEWLASEHALQSSSVLEVDDPRYGLMRQLGNICWLQGDDAVVDKQPAQVPHQDRTTVLQLLESWRDRPACLPQIDPEAPAKGWLDGVRILDLTNVIAGPTIACTLARFGAEVISIDPPQPALDPWNTTVFGMQANQGKRSVLLDLKSAQGQALLDKLLPQVDVITINASDAQLDRLGLSAERLQRLNPELILCQFDAFGGPTAGPRSNYPGYDDLVQATTGIMARFGGGLETPEEHAHFGTIDVLGGYCAAQAIGVALVRRAHGHGGAVARSSLVAAGQLIQVPFMYDYAGRGAFDEPSGREVKGAHAFYRCYQALDGWLFLALDRQRQMADLGRVLQLPELESADDKAAEQCLETLFRSQTMGHWQTLLAPVDIGCQPLGRMSQLRESSLMNEATGIDLNGPKTVAFIEYPDHPCGHRVELIAPNSIRLQRASVRLPGKMVKYGHDTRAVLGQLGCTPNQIEQMIEQGVAAHQWAERYLPS